MNVPNAAPCRIYFPDEWLGVAPSVLNLTRALCAAGYAPTLHAASFDPAYPVPVLPPEVRLDQITSVPFFNEHLACGTDDALAFLARQHFALQAVANSAKDGRAVFNIGVDAPGALAARTRQRLHGEPYVLLSLELPDLPSGSDLSRLAHEADLDALRNASALVIQDAARAAVLAQRFGALPRVILLPNGPSDVSPPLRAAPRDNIFRRKFGLSYERFPYLVVHAGMTIKEALIPEFVRATVGVPEFAFVLHERRRLALDDPDVAQFRATNSSNLFLSLEPVPYGDLASIYASIDIGIAYYRPINENFSEMAMASGKLGFYLRHGVPVVVNNLPSFRRLLDRYEFGVAIADPRDSAELSAALTKIVGSYDRYSANARECFLHEFDFNRNVLPLLSHLDAIAGRGQGPVTNY